MSQRYRTIVADPPWEVERSFGGANWRNGERRRPNLPYRTMTLAEIKELPVGKIADRDAHLYMWTTQGYLRHAYAIMEAWGFRPACVLAWCKPPGGFVGGTFFSNLEFIVFGRRGTLRALRRVSSQWYQWPRSEHSAKPDAFLDLVEQVSPGPYAELFARRARFGWDYPIGDQALGGVTA